MFLFKNLLDLNTKFDFNFSTTTTVPHVRSLPQDDIWFGNTPSPMYRGYATAKIKPKPSKIGPHFGMH